jgi:transcriptional regulator GlxA family with amidase domain
MTERVAFVLVPGFSLLALSAGIEVLRAANVARAERLFDWVLVAAESGPVTSSSALPLQAVGLAEAGACAVVAVCGGNRSHLPQQPALTRWLREMARAGALVGAFSDGSYVVAAAGLYDRVPSTIHWHCIDSYRERFPTLDVRATLFELHGRRFSCAGGTASLDLMLTVLRERYGADLAAAVAGNFMHDQIREASRVQRHAWVWMQAHSRPLAEAMRCMETQIDAPLRIGEIAARVGVSERQLDRLFRRHLRTAPTLYYRQLRLDHARHLLIQTGLSALEIAGATGFSSSAHLARAFRAHFGSSPQAYRRLMRCSIRDPDPVSSVTQGRDGLR